MQSAMSVETGRQRGLKKASASSCSRFSASAWSGRDAGARGYQRSSVRPLMETRLHVSTLEPPKTEEDHVMWFDKFPENWIEAHTEEELRFLLTNEQEKMIFIDLYAGFCGACKAAFPALSRVAGNPDFQKNFLFVKCCVTNEGIREFVRKNQITGIPTVMVCAPGGEKLISFGASFRKISAVKANLVVMAANRGAAFAIDPNGFVMPLPEHA